MVSWFTQGVQIYYCIIYMVTHVVPSLASGVSFRLVLYSFNTLLSCHSVIRCSIFVFYFFLPHPWNEQFSRSSGFFFWRIVFSNQDMSYWDGSTPRPSQFAGPGNVCVCGGGRNHTYMFTSICLHEKPGIFHCNPALQFSFLFLAFPYLYLLSPNGSHHPYFIYLFSQYSVCD